MPLSRSAGSHHPVRDIFWNSAGSMFADYLLAAVFDCQMCRTSAIRGSLKQTSGVRSRIAALPRTEDISQIDPCSRVRLSFRLLIGAHVLSAVAQHRLRSATATAKSIPRRRARAPSANGACCKPEERHPRGTENRSVNGLELVQHPNGPVAGHPPFA